LRDELAVRVPALPLEGGIGACDRRRLREPEQGDHERRHDQVRQIAERQGRRHRRQSRVDGAELRSSVADELAVEDCGDDREQHARKERMDALTEQQHDRHERPDRDRLCAPVGGMAERPACAVELVAPVCVNAERDRQLRGDDQHCRSRHEADEQRLRHQVRDDTGA